MGKGKGNSSAEDHQSTPLSALKDPASFGPPPKRVPGQTPGSPAVARADTGSLGAPLPRSQIEEDRQRQREREEAERRAAEEPPPPSGPYRVDTTGLSTAHLPRPPAFRPHEMSESPTAPSSGRPKPALPPRLPPRNPTHSNVPLSPPPSYNDCTHSTDPSRGMLNQGALNRLGHAGVSVPGFDIGSKSPPVPSRTSTTSPPVPSRMSAVAPPPPISPARNGPQLGELQSRFAKMNTTSPPPAAGTGTTWAQKQAALKTASDFKKDPSSVSFADAREAASTANNFRERHGEQAASGLSAANSLNQKYGVMDRMKSYSSDGTTPQQVPQPASGFGAASKKAPPPPPPAKKRELQSGPPPVPLGSKPKP
jgi:hypothetical protein